MLGRTSWFVIIIEIVEFYKPIGFLGQLATHAVVYAQLITPDGVNHSLHPFLVSIRNPKTLQPYPGIIVGDMGEKIGLNGIDNGYLWSCCRNNFELIPCF